MELGGCDQTAENEIVLALRQDKKKLNFYLIMATTQHKKVTSGLTHFFKQLPLHHIQSNYNFSKAEF